MDFLTIVLSLLSPSNSTDIVMAHFMPEDLLHPEVELRMKVLGNECSYPNKVFVTSLDVLELYPGGKVIIKKDMGDADFAEYCNTNDFTQSDGPLLRVFFVEELYLPLPVSSSARPTNPGDPHTALLMHKHFGVPMMFFLDQASHFSPRTIGNVTFVRRNKEGKKISLDGHYEFCSRYPNTPGYVWFSQSFEPKTRASHYIIHKAPAITKRLIFDCAQGSNWLPFTRPFEIDAFLMNDCILYLNAALRPARNKLVGLEMSAIDIGARQSDLRRNVKNVQILHSSAHTLRVVRGHLSLLEDTLDYLLEALKQITDPINCDHQIPDSYEESVLSSLVLLKSKAKWATHHTLSLEDRAKLKIDLEYTLENQRDSRTNLKIAHLTGNIAVSSQKDSSSMITMAAVTMFFLPATFVSALFSSTVFFTEGKLTVPPQWWIFPVITIPLTILVFGVWLVWKSRRNIVGSTELERLKIDDLEEGAPESAGQSSEEASVKRSPRPWRRSLPAFLSKMVDLKWHKVE